MEERARQRRAPDRRAPAVQGRARASRAPTAAAPRRAVPRRAVPRRAPPCPDRRAPRRDTALPCPDRRAPDRRAPRRASPCPMEERARRCRAPTDAVPMEEGHGQAVPLQRNANLFQDGDCQGMQLLDPGEVPLNIVDRVGAGLFFQDARCFRQGFGTNQFAG